MPDVLTLHTDYGQAQQYNSSGKPEVYDTKVPGSTIRDFNKLWYYLASQTLGKNTWMGIPIIKYPTDLFIYQQLIVELQPDLIVECGTAMGGSALYLAGICELVGKGRVLSIDIEDHMGDLRPTHPRLDFHFASSTDPAVVGKVKGRALVILDSDHRAPHVLAELRAYAPLAEYIVVEDTNINGHPVRPDFGPGPFEAVREFLASPEGTDWEMDRDRERLLLTAAPGGFLRRK